MVIDVLVAFVVSLAAGLIGSMVGIGGGIINAPYLSYLNYTPSQISSTSLIAVFFTSLSSSYQYIRKGLTEKKDRNDLGLFIYSWNIHWCLHFKFLYFE